MTEQFADLGPILVIIPTYNEIENVARITERVRAAVPEADILVADDNSPDGTGRIADELAAADEHIHVLHRLGKEGLAAAYMAGFAWGLERGYDVLIEMDADGSHQPEQLPAMLDALREADLVLGSRWIPGGEVVNWPKSREVLSRAATCTRAWHSTCRCMMRPADTGCSGPAHCAPSSWTTWPHRATASRSTWLGGACVRGCA